jgi:hypothetical protein
LRQGDGTDVLFLRVRRALGNRTFAPKAGPIGGAGFAFPASMANLIYPATFAAIVVTLLCPLFEPFIFCVNLAQLTDSPLNDALVPRLNAREETDV